MALLGFANALMLAAALAGRGPAEPADSLRCVRTTRWFPEVRQTVHCVTPAELAAWQHALEARRAEEAAAERRRHIEVAARRDAEARQWRARQDRRRYEMWLEERRREARRLDQRRLAERRQTGTQ